MEKHGTITSDNHAALWHGRFQAGPDAQAVAFETSIHVDERMALDDIRGSRAHAKMLGHAGIIPAEEAEQAGHHPVLYRAGHLRIHFRFQPADEGRFLPARHFGHLYGCGFFGSCGDP